MKKTLLPLLLVSVMLFSAFASGVTAYALPTPTSASSIASTTVYCLPDNTSSMTIGSIGIETVSVYWAEGNSYYIQYTVSSGAYSGYKRGYVPKSAISVSGIGGINYTSFSAHTSSNQTVYNRNTTSSMTIGTVYSSDNITVLQEDGTWYYIQYPVTGGYKRGYVPKSTVVVAGAQPTGYLDAVNSSLIGGWAWISSSPNTPIQVRIRITNKDDANVNIEKIVTANQYRSDLAAAGIGNGYHGFTYPINWNDYPKGEYSVRAYGIGGSNPQLSSSPKTYNLTSSTCFPSGTYRIKNVNSSKYLYVSNAGTTSGTSVVQYALSNNAAQHWSVTAIGDGQHVIYPCHTYGMALSVYDNYTNDGSNIVIRAGTPPSPGIYSRWNIVSVGNGAYKVVSKCSGTYAKVMAVQSASMANGANVIQYSYNGTHNDEWIFEQITSYSAFNWQYVFDDADFVKISNGYKSSHKAIDIISNNPSKSIANAPIRCPAAGKVVYANWDDGAGNYVIIETNYYDPVTRNKIRVGFQHLTSMSVSQGTTVSKGTVIGYVGTTGSYSTGYHLHLYMMRDSDDKWANGKTANPQNFYPNTSFTGSTGGPYTID